MLIIRELPLSAYQAVWERMKRFTQTRTNEADEVWLLEHEPVFTLGQAGLPIHILNPGDIPVVQTDRGGQVTYHGPGQLMVYTLINLRKQRLNIRELVSALEKLVINLLKDYGIEAVAKADAPGVYVNGAKICSVGLRVSRGFSYHGIALNVAMELEPFNRINPCGFKGLQMTQIRDFVSNITLDEVRTKIIPHFLAIFNYNQYQRVAGFGEQI